MGSSTEIVKSVIQRVGQAWLRQQLLSIHKNTYQMKNWAPLVRSPRGISNRPDSLIDYSSQRCQE